MPATRPVNRNRVAPFLNTTPPVTPADRQAAYADAVFAAVLALQAQLTHPDAKVVREAAGMILDFEKTRLRHGRPVAGTTEDLFAATERNGASDPAPFSRGEEEFDDEFAHYVERVRQDLELLKGRNGIPEVITREFAEQVARATRDPTLANGAT